MKTHEIAQEYELRSHKDWILEGDNYNTYLKAVKDLEGTDIITPHYVDMFFKGKEEIFRKFSKDVQNKNCMEVAGGILGVMPLWKNWIKGRKISIDPLLTGCDEFLKELGESWLTGIELYSDIAENKIPELVNTIDGFTLWRNGLDHMEDPELGLQVVSSYARKNSILLLWSDVKHKDVPDDGHKNIGDKPEDVENMVKRCGWDVYYRTPNIHEHIGMVEYGCVAIKK